MNREISNPSAEARGRNQWLVASGLAILAAAVAIWQFVVPGGTIDPLAARTNSMAGVIDIGVLVFREGLECVLVLAALTAGMKRDRTSTQHAIPIGVAAGLVATVVTWAVAVRIMDDLGQSVPALALQATTGLVAVAVLLIVMNWFFHKVYWTGWISLHTERRRELTLRAQNNEASNFRLMLGMILLGFSSVYCEGFEVVLFLQSYRLRLGKTPVYWGAGAGVILTAGVALLTFVLHRKLPYRRMLVFTGVLLGIVLMSMVGEQVQEMQLAGWIPATTIPSLSIPAWMSLWFSLFPTVESIAAQTIAAVLVIGSYFVASRPRALSARESQSAMAVQTSGSVAGAHTPFS